MISVFCDKYLIIQGIPVEDVALKKMSAGLVKH